MLILKRGNGVSHKSCSSTVSWRLNDLFTLFGGSSSVEKAQGNRIWRPWFLAFCWRYSPADSTYSEIRSKWRLLPSMFGSMVIVSACWDSTVSFPQEQWEGPCYPSLLCEVNTGSERVELSDWSCCCSRKECKEKLPVALEFTSVGVILFLTHLKGTAHSKEWKYNTLS